MRVLVLLAAILAILSGCVHGQRPGTAAGPSGSDSTSPLTPASRGAFASGKYRNLFVEQGHSAGEVQDKLTRAYQQLFHGDPDIQAVMFAAGENGQGKLAYIKDIGHDDIRSEGMSYGMMIAVQMNEKEDFDALWNWAKTYMYHAEPTHPCYGYFSWQMRSDGTAVDEMPAPDGEEYFATALLFAANRWGNRSGIYDYAAQAEQLISDMKNRRPIEGTVNQKRSTTAVALFNPDHKMVRFTPDTGNFASNGDHTDPSYHLPAFYELWARWGPEQDRAFWTDAARVSRDFFVKAAHPKTGLTPDYADFDGTPKAASWDANTVQFRWDAWRTAMNWAMDAAWWAKDPRQIELSDRLLAFFESQGATYGNNFTLEGEPTSPGSSLGLVATNAAAALSASHPRASKFVDALYEAEPPTGQWRYYDGMLYLMSFMHVSGNFRIYAPK
jgi:oligosaccharide reducing-end xylanase